MERSIEQVHLDDARSDQHPVLGFIVGMSRSGTRWLSECLNEHPDVAVIGETSFWGKKYIEPSGDGTYSLEQLEHLRRIHRAGGRATAPSKKLGGSNGLASKVLDQLRGEAGRVGPREVFDGICAAIANEENKRYVLEKTPHHINWIDRINKFYPEARYIVMMREPYGFMLSYKHQGDRREEDTMFSKIYHPIGCAMVYRRYAKSIGEIVNKYKREQVLLIDYEDVKCRPREVLAEVQDFLGLFPSAILLPPKNSSFPGGEVPSLKSDDVFWLNLIASKELKRLGVEPRKREGGFIRIAISLLLLPIWVCRVLLHMQHKVKDNRLGYLKRWIS